MTDDASMMDRLGAYLQVRQEQRIESVDEKWASLSKREQRLVQEAAVMGYVQGHRHHDSDIPKDARIVEMVLGAVDHFADLYPVLAALPRKKRLR